MEKLNLSQYADIYYDKERDYIIIHWLNMANDLLPDEGFEQLKKIYEHILPLKPKYVLINVQDLLFPFTPSFMNRVSNELYPVILKAGTIKKTAYVISHEFAMKIGIELLNRKLYAFGDQIQRMVFESKQQAEDWLFS